MIQVVVLSGIVLAIVLLVLLSTYNGLMSQRQQVRAAWAAMDEQLKNRYDLIPPLVTTVQSIGGEPATKLPAINAAKNQAAVAFNPTQLAVAEIALTIAIHDLLKVAGRDGSLNADSRFIETRQKLLACEKQIDKARKRYNDRVENLNQSLGSFPTAVTAKLMGLKPQPAFELPVEAA